MEQDYIKEWITYYLHIGVDRIYLYENDNQPVYAELLKEYKQVTVIPFPGPGTPEYSIQYLILDHFCRNFKDKHRWFAHFDCDEFLVLKKHRSIQELCEEYLSNEEGGLGISWVMFGNNYHTTKTSDPVTFRFTQCEDVSPTNVIEVKSILCSSCLEHYVENFHAPELKSGHIYNTNGDRIIGNKSSQVTDIVQLNHYFCKTYEEFQMRKIRGDVGYPSNHPKRYSNTRDSRDKVKFFNYYNRNKVIDLQAKEFYESYLTKIKTQE